jgi:hypothetical protein
MLGHHFIFYPPEIEGYFLRQVRYDMKL